MGTKTQRNKFVKDMVIARKDGTKIVSIGTFVDYNDLYINFKGKNVALSVVDLLADYSITGTPKQAKDLGHDVVRLSKTDADTQIFLYANKEKICNVIGLQICRENGDLICYLPCQQYDVEDFVTSPLLEKIDEDTALIKMYLVATKEGSIVVQAQYVNVKTNARDSKMIAIKNDGKTYNVANSSYSLQDAQIKANVKKEHIKLPLLAQISLYGDDLLNPLLKTIKRTYKYICVPESY